MCHQLEGGVKFLQQKCRPIPIGLQPSVEKEIRKVSLGKLCREYKRTKKIRNHCFEVAKNGKNMKNINAKHGKTDTVYCHKLCGWTIR